MIITTIETEGERPRTCITWYDPDHNKMVVVSANDMWAEVTITATDEYLGWVPVPMIEAHGKGYVSARELRAAARPVPPEGLQRMRGPWR